MKRNIYKALSMLLTAAMVLNMGLIPAFAEEATPTGISGICTHHTAHKVNGGEADREDPLGGTEDCGYQQGTPCNHEHTDGCYTKVLTCTITVGGTPEIATDSEAVLDSGEPAEKAEAHIHDEDCFTKTENCKHEHDETCGYIPDSPCTYDPESCTECDTDKQPEQVCTCEPVDSGNLPQGEMVHGEGCPLYTTPALSEAVKALIAMVDALPNAADITEKNKETTMSTYDAVATAYDELSDEDKAVFKATEQYKKLRALHSVLYPLVLMANEATHNISTGDLTLTDACGNNCGGHSVTGDTTTYKIIVSGGTHNITLNNVSIDVGTINNACAFLLVGNATVNLTLAEGSDNTLKSGEAYAGLQVASVGDKTATLTIGGTGSLNATGGRFAAGIGGGFGGGFGGDGGIITISGGTVNATGSDRGAGIGGGTNGIGGDITISGGEIKATGGNSAAGIGGGQFGAGGIIKIGGGQVTALGGSSGFGAGAGIGGGDFGDGGDITISGGTVTATGGNSGSGGGAAGIGGGEGRDGGDIAIDGGTVTATGGDYGAGIGGGNGSSGGNITISGGTVTATGGIYAAGIGGGSGGSGGSITIGGGEVKATGGKFAAGIGGGSSGGGGGSITIGGDNTNVTATGGAGGGAGIGGGDNGSGGDITISGGMVSAMCSDWGAGIGGGSSGGGGAITISGGTVDATGGNWGAGIGGGYRGDGGDIAISGDNTNVTATGGGLAAGIGGGYRGSGGSGGSGGTITISGGVITATGGDYGAGIGGGYSGDGGTFSTQAGGSTGNAFIIASSIGDKRSNGNWSGVIFEGDSGKVYGSPTLTTDAEIPAGKTLTIDSGKALTIDSGVTLTNNGTITNNGIIQNYGTISGIGNVGGDGAVLEPPKSFSVSGGTLAKDYTYTHDMNTSVNVLTFVKNGTYTVSMKGGDSQTTADTIVVKNGITASITLDGVNIDVSRAKEGTCAFEITGNSTVNLTLKGANVLKSAKYRAGLRVPIGNTLTITSGSTDSLAATGGEGGAGIGGDDSDTGGTITINGGDITAQGGNRGAGIGGCGGGATGGQGHGGTVTISGDSTKVTATGGKYGAGIGGGGGGDGGGGNGGSITIDGGDITATGGGGGAGIGGGDGGSGGDITISGGDITANGGQSGAGIGGGYNGGGGTITIDGGEIKATGGAGGGGIGGGAFGYGGTITISGGTVEATGGDKGAGIGGGYNGGSGVTFATQADDGSTGNAFIIASSIADKNSHTNWNGVIFEGDYGKVYGNPTLTTDAEIPAGKTLTIENGKTLTIDSGVTLTNNGTIQNYGTISGIGNVGGGGAVLEPPKSFSVSGGTLAQHYTYTHDVNTSLNVLTFVKGGTYTVSMKSEDSQTTTATIVVKDGITANITLNGVNIDVSGAGDGACAFEITGSSTVNLTLKGANVLKSAKYRAGLRVPIGNTLTITSGSTDSLAATGGEGGAGIGGNDSDTGGNININGGDITAKGGDYGAGIGGGDAGNGGTITISGGAITATGGAGGSGIGGGYNGGGGTITIDSGTVTATGGNYGAGIGGGDGDGGDITIEGGDITAMGGDYGAGIGGGNGGGGGSITIDGDNTKVTATGGDGGAGIGGGSRGSGSDIAISGGTVTAMGGRSAAGIGGGNRGSGGTFATNPAGQPSGNAFIIASSIGDNENQGNWNGVIFEGDSGKVYGNPTLTTDAEIPADKTLTIDNGKALTINSGVTLTNNGTIKNYGTIVNNGAITGNGTVLKNSQTTVTFAVKQSNGNYGNTTTTATYGDTVKITATMAAPQTKGRRAAVDTVDFYLGSVDGKKLNENPIPVSSNGGKATATFEVTLNSDNWKPSDIAYTITADFGGYTTGKLLDSVGTGTLTVRKRAQDTPAAVFTATSENSGTLSNVTAKMKYSVNGGTSWVDIGGTSITITGVTPTHGIKIKQPGNNSTTTDSEVQTISVSKGAAVQGVSATGCTNASNNDGKLSGVTAVMEYSLKSSNVWRDGTGGEITGLASGTYLVRTKAAGPALTGDTSEFTVSQYTPAPTYRINLSQSGTYTFAGATAGYGTQTPLTVTVQNTGNQVTGELTVALSGANSGSFTLSKDKLNTIVADGTDSVTIVPNTGLAVGTYTATVTVSGRNNISASFNVNFTVKSSTPSGGGGNGGGDSTTTPPTVVTKPTTPENPNPSTTVQTDVSSKTDRNGKATATVGDKSVTDAIKKAQDEAKKNGTEKNGISIVLNVKMDKNATSLEVTLSKATIDALIRAGVTEFTIKNALSSVTFDLATLKALTGGEVKLSIGKVDVKTLSAEAQQAIGNRSVFQYGVTVGGKAVTDFKGGRASLQMPYTRTTTEQTGNLVGVYVDGSGKVTWLENSSYDPITGMMLASTSHFSIYGVGYKQSTPKFTDVGTHWAKNDIDFVVARGLLSGTSNTTFAPETSMTRGMFVTALGRLAGIDTKKYSNTKFVDVKADAYYSPYVAWASVNNIVNGTSDTTFSPDKAISRQEMAVMLVNYSKTIGYKLPSVHAQVSFTDAGSIASWAKDAVGQMQMAGILMGKSGNRFDPTATATRAEVSAMLRRFVELVASTETAEGWAMNESGQWMYIQDGKRITGKKNIDGTAYTFDQYGVTTALPPERKYLTSTVQTGDSFWSIAQKYKVSMFELAKLNSRSIFSFIQPGDVLQVPQQ